MDHPGVIGSRQEGPIRLVKMHGLGNDYLFLDLLAEGEGPGRLLSPEEVRFVSDRHRGFGSDGVIAMLRPEGGRAAALGSTDGAQSADCTMRIWNRDGSEGEMCGNGLRCVVKYLYETGYVSAQQETVRVATGAGVLTCWPIWQGGRVVRVRERLGMPRFPVPPVAQPFAGETEVAFPLRWTRPGSAGAGKAPGPDGGAALTREHAAVLVTLGNPHVVLFSDVGSRSGGQPPWNPGEDGPALEHHPWFPEGVNVGFADVISPEHVRLTVWERGSGLTQACGTGAAAALAAGMRTGRLTSPCRMDLPGGTLWATWPRSDASVELIGPAEHVGVCLFEPEQVTRLGGDAGLGGTLCVEVAGSGATGDLGRGNR